MSLTRKVTLALPPAVRDRMVDVAVHRDLYLSATTRRDQRPIALVHGNCQAEALRRILATHPGFAGSYRLLRVPAVHEISRLQLHLIERLLPDVQVLIGQEVRPGYRGMRLGTDELAARLPTSARVLRYPVAYFEGMFPFQVYVNRPGSELGSPAPISDYHDLRTMFAAGQGWDLATTLRRLDGLKLDPSWVQANAEKSLRELADRETRLDARLSGAIGRNPATSFNTINHPVNGLVTEVARQLLQHLGHQDADRVLSSKQTYLEHMSAPREPRIAQALGAWPGPQDQQEWRTSAGRFSRAEVVAAHLRFYAADPALLAEGLHKHRDRLKTLAEMWN